MRKLSLAPVLMLLMIFESISLAQGLSADTQAQRAQSQPNEGSFQEEIIGQLSPKSQFRGWSWSANGRHLAWCEKSGSDFVVRFDGKQQGGVYKDLGDFTANAEGTHSAFFGKRESKWILVSDAVEGSQEYSKVSSFAFQPLGSALAYAACASKKDCHLIVNGTTVGAQYDDISHPKYSADGTKIAYFGKRKNNWIAVVDGKEVELQAVAWRKPEPLSDFSNFGFSKDGSHFFVAGHVDDVVVWTYFIDGKPGPWFQVLSPIAFSSDGKNYAYAGSFAQEPGLRNFKKRKVTGTIVSDGKVVASYTGSPIRGSWEGLVSLGRYSELIRGVRDLDPDFYGVSAPEFSPAGKLVYAARRDSGDVAVLFDGNAGPGFDNIVSSVVFSEDSQHFAYVAKRGTDILDVRDNVAGHSNPTSGRNPLTIEWIAFSKNGVHLAYQTLAARGAQATVGSVIVDGHESKIYNAVGNPQFSDDDKSLHFFALDGERLLRVSFSLE